MLPYHFTVFYRMVFSHKIRHCIVFSPAFPISWRSESWRNSTTGTIMRSTYQPRRVLISPRFRSFIWRTLFSSSFCCIIFWSMSCINHTRLYSPSSVPRCYRVSARRWVSLHIHTTCSLICPLSHNTGTCPYRLPYPLGIRFCKNLVRSGYGFYRRRITTKVTPILNEENV